MEILYVGAIIIVGTILGGAISHLFTENFLRGAIIGTIVGLIAAISAISPSKDDKQK